MISKLSMVISFVIGCLPRPLTPVCALGSITQQQLTFRIWANNKPTILLLQELIVKIRFLNFDLETLDITLFMRYFNEEGLFFKKKS